MRRSGAAGHPGRRLLAAVATLLLLAGCAFEAGDQFPEPSFSPPDITLPAVPTPTGVPSPPEATLRIALPLTSDTLDRLARYYHAIRIQALYGNGGTPSDLDPVLVNPDTLPPLPADFRVTLLATPLSGLSADALSLLDASGQFPDLYMTRRLLPAMRLGQARDLTDEAVLQPYLDPGKVPVPLVEAGKFRGRLVGLPWNASARLVFVNLDLVRDSLQPLPSDRWTLEDLTRLARSLRNPDAMQFAFSDLTEWLRYLPAQMDRKTGWAAWNGTRFDFDGPVFDQSVTLLRTFVEEALSLHHLTQEELTEAYLGTDPRASGHVAFWFGDSTDIDFWSNTTEYDLTVLPPPAGTEGRLPVTVNLVCVSGRTESAAEAVRMAGFLALDPRSTIFLARTGYPKGMLPAVRDERAWDRVFDGVGKGEALRGLWSLQDHMVASGVSNVPGWDEAVAATFDAEKLQLVLGGVSVEEAGPRMSAEADRILSEEAVP